ncbi:30S ribosomal protein S9 [Candidatus Microgenomates bacterium]|nr:MAG: 30S ribosomal protein S9 [Candidatus Microgenomates bacterium]
MAELKEEKPVKTKTKKNYIATVGRRKNAVARVRLYDGVSEVLFGEQPVKKGEVFVNSMLAEKYFGSEVAKVSFMEPFRITNTLNKFIATIKVAGGGKAGQLDAVIHGISRGLSTFDTEKYRKILKKKGFLTRDSRIRERRKVGTGGKARRAKQSPKR